ncbi:hypothetical protein F441_00904, partial [Phytophthora nicotianae CJ01A1]
MTVQIDSTTPFPQWPPKGQQFTLPYSCTSELRHVPARQGRLCPTGLIVRAGERCEMATEQAQTMLVAAMYADAVLAQGSFASGPVDRWQRCRCAGGMELVAV